METHNIGVLVAAGDGWVPGGKERVHAPLASQLFTARRPSTGEVRPFFVSVANAYASTDAAGWGNDVEIYQL